MTRRSMTNTGSPLYALSSRTSWCCLLAATVLLCFANGRWIVPVAAWLAPAFLLLFLFSQPAGRGLLLGFSAQLISYFIAWRGMIPVPGLWYFVVAGVYASAYFLPFVVYRLLVPRPAGFVATLLLPASWVAIEFLFQRFITPYGSWMSLAYTQTGNLPILQLAALTGLGGITFMMVWGAAVAVWVWMERANAAHARLGAVTYVSILLAIMAWGTLRIVTTHPNGESIRIAMITPSPSRTRDLNEAMRALPASGAADDADRSNILAIAGGLNADLLRRSRMEARTGSKIIAWSETAARITAGSKSDFMREAGELSKEMDVTLVMGVGAWRPDEQYAFENEVVVARSSGEILAPFRKAHPIAGQESSLIEAGDRTIKVFDTEYGRCAAAICHDLDFPDLIRTAGRRRVTLLFGPSADWPEITHMHARMAIVRAVENGCSLVRPCSNGLSLVADPLGKIIASQTTRGADGDTMAVRVPLLRLNTVYPLAGYLFPVLIILCLPFVLVPCVRSSRRRSDRAST